MNETEQELLELLRKYHHYKIMTQGLFSFFFQGKNCGMSFDDFIQWLKSREE